MSALLCIGAFINGGTRIIDGGEPEMVEKVTRGGIPGSGF